MSTFLIALGPLFLLGVIGIIVSVWLRAVRLRQLDDMPLSLVEREHPYIPSLDTVISLAGCYVSFLTITAVSLLGSDSLGETRGLLPICILFLSGGISIISELYSQAARLTFVGLALGGVTTMSVLIMKQTAASQGPWSFVFLSLSLVVLAAGLLVDLRRSDGLHVHHWPVVLTNILWLLLWMLR